MKNNREDRLQRLVAVCVKKNRNPDKPGFADTIESACSLANIPKRAMNELKETMIRSYRKDRWGNYITDNPHLNEEEKQTWIQKNLLQ